MPHHEQLDTLDMEAVYVYELKRLHCVECGITVGTTDERNVPTRCPDCRRDPYYEGLEMARRQSRPDDVT